MTKIGLFGASALGVMVALTGCSSGGGESNPAPTATVTSTPEQPASPAASSPASGGGTVSDPSSIREFAACDPSQAGIEINGFRGSPLKCDGSQWVPQY